MRRKFYTGCATFFFCLCFGARAQYFQFSQYNYTGQRINPALVATSDYVSVSFDYRHQLTAGGFNLNSNFLDVSYPFIARNGTRWSGVGLSFMDDRTGGSMLFQTQEAAISYALNIALSKRQSLALGAKVLYQNNRMNMDGLFTGSQFIPDRGFDESLFNGESQALLQSNHVSLNLGLLWQQVDRRRNLLAHAGFSFFDFNKPNDSFLEESNSLNSTAVATLGFTAYKKQQWSILPEMLITLNSNTTVFNIGTITRYQLTNRYKGFNDHLDLLTKMVPGRSVILGFQLHRELFSLGLSYDFPAGEGSVSNTGALEIGLSLRKLVKRAKRAQSDKRKNEQTKKVKPVVTNTTLSKNENDSTETKPIESAIAVGEVETMSNRLKHKQDSIAALAQAGVIRHEPYVVEQATLHFNFEFNSADLDEESSRYLEDLSKAMLDNPQLKIKLMGHTDNVGSDKFNLKLSIYRAQAIKDFIVGKGVRAERIMADGKGLREPLNANKTEQERAINRRVELTILYED
jgi:type IX secretion system PorP/SprF family membrane protein